MLKDEDYKAAYSFFYFIFNFVFNEELERFKDLLEKSRKRFSIFFKLNEQLNLPNSRLIDKSLVEALEYFNKFIPEDNSNIKDFVLNFGKKIRELIDS